MLEMNTRIYQCRHLFADGHRCGSKSLRHEEFCFYHHSTRKPMPRQTESPNTSAFDLAFPEDRTAIQSNIGEVLRRIATNTIDVRRAGLLLYGLQIASLNLPKTPPGRNPEDDDFDDIVEEVIDDPIHGPLATPAEFVHPEDRRQGRPTESLTLQLMRELGEINEDGNPINIQATEASEAAPTPTPPPPSRPTASAPCAPARSAAHPSACWSSPSSGRPPQPPSPAAALAYPQTPAHSSSYS